MRFGASLALGYNPEGEITLVATIGDETAGADPLMDSLRQLLLSTIEQAIAQADGQLRLIMLNTATEPPQRAQELPRPSDVASVDDVVDEVDRALVTMHLPPANPKARRRKP